MHACTCILLQVLDVQLQCSNLLSPRACWPWGKIQQGTDFRSQNAGHPCRAMFDGHYKEKEASTIPVPNIKWPVFTSMMRAIYTGRQFLSPAWSQLAPLL